MIKLKWSKGTGKKKYKVEIFNKDEKIKTIQFGHTNYKHYKDRTPLKLYSHLDHKDKGRRAKYKARHSKIRTKSGKRAIDIKYSPAWFSNNYLW